MGKGDKRRPTLIDDGKFEQNWQAIFGGKREASDAESGMAAAGSAAVPCSAGLYSA
jgi:hypothetical protein